MDQMLLRQREAKCVQENPPGCTAGCPVHVDARGIAVAVRNEDYAKGFALFHRMIPFPGIISRICDQPCRQSCKRSEIDEPILIKGLEKICVDNNHAVPQKAFLQVKSCKIAIVGAGLSSLTAAYELAQKGFKVTVFEATNRLGGSVLKIPEKLLPLQVIENDFSVLSTLPVEIKYNEPIGKNNGTINLGELCETFAAVYVGVGRLENILDLSGLIDPLTLSTGNPQVFAGGSMRRNGELAPVFSIADGKIAAVSIERFLQNASLTANRDKEGQFKTSLYTNIAGIMPQPVTPAADPGNGYTKEEALQEANRCLLCECLECVKACEYLAHYRAYPKRYVREIYNNLSIVMGIHRANKMINSCSLCGLCEQVCPGNLNMGEICQQARQMMVEKGKMPPSVHDFALRDMQFSTSDKFTLARHQPGYTTSEFVFYPGCQLAASSPDYVRQTYRFLREKLDGGVGLMLGCCGAPASWAGQESLFLEKLQSLETAWRRLGNPKVITACPSCYSLFKQNLPSMPVESLWTLFDRISLPGSNGLAETPRKLAIHDSCTTRYDSEIQLSVRNILGKLGFQIEELPYNRETTVCCGYGGLMLYANKEVTGKVISRRINESATDYLTYCVMCRDNFAGQGKRVYHLLDLIFGKVDTGAIEGPGLSKRQENRTRLKTDLLREVWGETVNELKAAVKVVIPENVLRIMEERMIIVDDVTQVIAYAENTGNKLLDAESGYYIAYYQPASVTYWVEYKPDGDAFVVRNAYCHRINITG